MGAVTGKGLSDLIREEFGFRVTFFLMLALVVTNFGNVMAEFAGVASSLELFGISQLHRRAARRGDRLAAGRPGHLQQRREDLPRRVGFYVCYIVAGILAHPDWQRRRVRDRHAAAGRRHPQLRLPVHGHRPGRHDDRAVDAVLPAGVDRRKGRDGAAVPRLALGRHRRLPLRRDRRVVHHRRLRGDAARRRAHGDPRRRRRRTGAAAARRRVRVPAVCGRAVQRLAVRGVDPADLDGVRGLRGAGVRVGARQEVSRSAGVLLALHAAHRRRRRRAAGAAAFRSRTSWCCRRSSTASCCRSC